MHFSASHLQTVSATAAPIRAMRKTGAGSIVNIGRWSDLSHDRSIASSFDFVLADLGKLRSAMWNRYEQGLAFWYKKPSTSAVCRIDFR